MEYHQHASRTFQLHDTCTGWIRAADPFQNREREDCFHPNDIAEGKTSLISLYVYDKELHEIHLIHLHYSLASLLFGSVFSKKYCSFMRFNDQRPRNDVMGLLLVTKAWLFCMRMCAASLNEVCFLKFFMSKKFSPIHFCSVTTHFSSIRLQMISSCTSDFSTFFKAMKKP
jgi:hypothetical protein